MAGASGTPSKAPLRRAADDDPATRSPAGDVKLVGGLIALAVGVVAVAVLAGGAMIAAAGDAATIATAAFGVIGSIVGAYFGVKIGTDGTQKAVQAHQDEATRAQVFAAHLQPEKADLALEQARAMVNDQPLPTQRDESRGP
ncbi:MAG TPA: hypothetical protein VHR88_05285 [Solirubrobacteraceae bacterium]|nr:hypothetical protein [Solirubrobacteraceae bacterium]